jgi:hypothetical protein
LSYKRSALAVRQREEERQFAALAAEWLDDMADRSVISFRHPAYKKIIEMGEPAVPLLLRELEKSSGHWFEALRKITGKDPVPHEARGNFARMREAWLAFGKEHRYIA